MSDSTPTWTPACGAVVRRAREAAELSQEELGSKVGVAANTISRIETGSRKPSVEVLFALSDALAIDLNLLKPDPLSEAPTEPYPDLVAELDPPTVV